MEEIKENEILYTISASTSYKKDLKKHKKGGTKVLKLVEALKILSEMGVEGIPSSMKPHKLIGKYKGSYECHIEPDFLLIWYQDEDEKTIVLERLGSHSELFG
ncbi:type II toxin-antitoxin system YafQ family toxin [uncultured Capnocytophaga sp.]|jgi:addiction module toxin, relE/stbE family|uniref:type II toxin-antitoxin system YafQ family toxin n=1 Tax=uncultured Capnocytophaga sp. TaxID=159273 RepID=UPI002639BD9D|nr:type II toxin-antitoxin system YafQ family toxin [uncultured Capnocytophaga sp.]